jgi:RNA polymerase sigma-70 factor (ECF subfamily)
MVGDKGKEDAVEAVAATYEPVSTPLDELKDIFEQHHRQVFHAAYRVTGNASDAEDVMQTVFLRLLRRYDKVDLSQGAGGYLHRAAVNAALDLVRSKRVTSSVPISGEATSVMADDTPDPERRQASSELRHHLRSALGALSPRAAEVFVLRHIEGLGNREIADMLETSPSVVAVTLHRATRRLRSALASFHGRTS